MCHQTVSLVAQALEEAGISTVTIGSARDIVEHAGAPRYLFTDFPLGNPCGVPFDRQMQADILASALALLETAAAPGTIVDAPQAWPGDQDWRWRYNYVGPENREELAAIGAARRDQQADNKAAEKA